MQSYKKKKNKKVPKGKKSPVVYPDKKEEEETSGFDFGGLPARDLKKNLGCG